METQLAQITKLGTNGQDIIQAILSGADTMAVFGRDGNDTLTAVANNHGQEASLSIFGGAGDDMLLASIISDKGQNDLFNKIVVTLDGGSGNDWLFATRGYQELFGGKGNDYLVSFNGCSLSGDEGDDILVGGGVPGNVDDYNGMVGGSGQDLVICGPNGDVVMVGDDTERDVVFGGVGDDVFSAGLEDILYGGGGADQFYFNVDLMAGLIEGDPKIVFHQPIQDFNADEGDAIAMDLGDLSGVKLLGTTLKAEVLTVKTNYGVATFDFTGLTHGATEPLRFEVATEQFVDDHGTPIGFGSDVTVWSGDQPIADLYFTQYLDSVFG